MAHFKIYTDSTSDLTQDLVDQLDVTVVPTDFIIDGKTYLDFPDEREMSRKDFWKLIRDHVMPTTAVINPERFKDYYTLALKEGYDILHIVFSSGLTSTMQNALLAAEELKEIYPDRTITVVDSRAASLGKGLLVYYAAQQKKEGKSAEEIAAWVEQTRDHVCHWFTVDDLQHLRRGGRVTVTTAAVGGVLNIKPIMHIDIEGKLVPTDKVRGRKAALEMLLNKVRDTAVDIESQTVFLVHGDCEEDASWMAQEIKSRFHVKNVYMNLIGPVIGTHAGPGAIGVLFLGTEK